MECTLAAYEDQLSTALGDAHVQVKVCMRVHDPPSYVTGVLHGIEMKITGAEERGNWGGGCRGEGWLAYVVFIGGSASLISKLARSYTNSLVRIGYVI